jgi:hypothetical protein
VDSRKDRAGRFERAKTSMMNVSRVKSKASACTSKAALTDSSHKSRINSSKAMDSLSTDTTS